MSVCVCTNGSVCECGWGCVSALGLLFKLSCIIHPSPPFYDIAHHLNASRDTTRFISGGAF